MLSTRFAPSPTGFLHVGNALSALLCAQWASKHQAKLYLRIEDIDHTRCRADYIQAIRDDLQWLGIHWNKEMLLQSDRLIHYQKALDKLKNLSVIYPCFCTRANFATAPKPALQWFCPQACVQLAKKERQQKLQQHTPAWRLHCQAAWQLVPQNITWQDNNGNHHRVKDNISQDPIIGRKDIQYSYHLAVVIDDAQQQISHVIRGTDLWLTTAIHRLLQALLGLPSPIYWHHPLLKDHHGNRLAKQSSSISLQELRHHGVQASKLREYLLHTHRPTWPPSNNVTQLTLTT